MYYINFYQISSHIVIFTQSEEPNFNEIETETLRHMRTPTRAQCHKSK